MIPHITDEIKRRIKSVNESNDDFDVVITEVGGTVGDIEGQPFYEVQLGQMILEEGKRNSLVIHTTLLPFIDAAGEIKKPTQHSVMTLREIGLAPDIVMTLREKIKKETCTFL